MNNKAIIKILYQHLELRHHINVLPLPPSLRHAEADDGEVGSAGARARVDHVHVVVLILSLKSRLNAISVRGEHGAGTRRLYTM
jgi:hypothetical protein